jgi:hypothetical protein
MHLVTAGVHQDVMGDDQRRQRVGLVLPGLPGNRCLLQVGQVAGHIKRVSGRKGSANGLIEIPLYGQLPLSGSRRSRRPGTALGRAAHDRRRRQRRG